MKYVDMPRGTVLRNPDGDIAFKTTSVHRAWFCVFADGETDRVPFPLGDGWVELVAKPAALVDGQGYRWEPPVEPVYRIRLDQGFSDWLTRAEIEAEDGPLTEATE